MSAAALQPVRNAYDVGLSAADVRLVRNALWCPGAAPFASVFECRPKGTRLSPEPLYAPMGMSSRPYQWLITEMAPAHGGGSVSCSTASSSTWGGRERGERDI